MKMKYLMYSLFLLLIVACGNESNDETSAENSKKDFSELIVGDWETTEINGKTPKTVSCIIFNEDGTNRFYYLNEELTAFDDGLGKGKGNWHIDGNILHLNQDKMNPGTYEINSLSESEMTYTSIGGAFKVKLRYKKRNK